MVPTTIGFNLQFKNSGFWHPYIGVGGGAAWIHIHDHGAFVRKYTIGWGVASLFQAGMEFDITQRLLLDFFGAYRWNGFSFNNNHSQTGGWQVGGGIGSRF